MDVGFTFIGYEGPYREFISMVQQAEHNGMDNVSFPDDLWMRDVFVSQTATVRETDRIHLTFITNPYTRHPVLVGRAVASINELSPHRIRVCFCPGGSFTLRPLGIHMWDRPLTYIREAVAICRLMFSGSTVDFAGKIFTAKRVQLKFPHDPTPPPIFIAGRGLKLLSLAGEIADGIFINQISPKYEQMVIESIFRSARQHHRNPNQLKLYTSVTYTHRTPPEFRKFAALRVASVLRDTPLEIIESFKDTISSEAMGVLEQIHATNDVHSAVSLVNDEIVALYHGVANTPEQLLQIAKNQQKKGYKELGIIIPAGEETKIIASLSAEFIDDIHNLR